MKQRELLMTALTFCIVAAGLGWGVRALALSRAEQELRVAFEFLSTLRRRDEGDFIDRVYSGDPQALERSCVDLGMIRPELSVVALYGPTFQPLAGAGKVEGVRSANIDALSARWIQQADSAHGTAHGFVDQQAGGRRLVYLAPLRTAGQPLAWLRIDYDLSSIDGGRRLMVLTVVASVFTTLGVHVLLLSWARRRAARRQR